MVDLDASCEIVAGRCSIPTVGGMDARIWMSVANAILESGMESPFMMFWSTIWDRQDGRCPPM